jgi:hypothetical protein
MPQTPASPPNHARTGRSQHDALALTTLARIKRYVEADLDSGEPNVEHAEQILLAAGTYLKQAVSRVKDGECAARHEKAA